MKRLRGKAPTGAEARSVPDILFGGGYPVVMHPAVREVRTDLNFLFGNRRLNGFIQAAGFNQCLAAAFLCSSRSRPSFSGWFSRALEPPLRGSDQMFADVSINRYEIAHGFPELLQRTYRCRRLAVILMSRDMMSAKLRTVE